MRSAQRHKNPALPRDSTSVLYRGISPQEMLDVLRSGRIVGRGNAFSGDSRSTLVFFAEADPSALAHQGDDSVRAVQSDPKFVAAFDAIHAARDPLERRMHALDYDDWSSAKERMRLRAALRPLDARFKRLQDKMFAEAHKRKTVFAEKHDGITSFVLELHDVPGGTRFTAPDSFHDGDEVGFDRASGVSAKYIAWVYPVRGTGHGKLSMGEPMTLTEAARLLRVRLR
jgi:hypothetical protein